MDKKTESGNSTKRVKSREWSFINDVKTSIDTELSEMDEIAFFKRDAEYFKRIEISTYVRNAICLMEFNDDTAYILYQNADCFILKDIYSFWVEQGMKWGESQEEKIDAANVIVKQYLLEVKNGRLEAANE